MSELRINNITDTAGSSGPIIAGVSTVTSTSHMVMPSGPTEMRYSPSEVDLSGNQKILSSGGRGRGITGGGVDAPNNNEINIISMIEIATQGNAVDFGDLTEARRDAGAVGSSVRGVFAAGRFPSQKTTIDYVTFSSSGGANDFGENRISLMQNSGVSDGVRGIFAGGVKTSPTVGNNTIEFITIATTGDSNSFGELSSARWGASGVNSPTRGVFAAGATPTYIKSIEFVTIATLGDSQDFGEVSTAVRNLIPACSSTRGVFAGAQTSTSSPYSYKNTIEFLTIATLGNTSDFGDLVSARSRGAGVSNSIRGCFIGGQTTAPTNDLKSIDVVTIATTGNASDFGDISALNESFQGASDSHGGLGD